MELDYEIGVKSQVNLKSDSWLVTLTPSSFFDGGFIFSTMIAYDAYDV